MPRDIPFPVVGVKWLKGFFSKFYVVTADQAGGDWLVLLCLTEDSNMERQQAVGMKINKYLLKADELYQTHLVSCDGEQVAWNRWGVSSSNLTVSASSYLIVFVRTLKDYLLCGSSSLLAFEPACLI